MSLDILIIYNIYKKRNCVTQHSVNKRANAFLDSDVIWSLC